MALGRPNDPAWQNSADDLALDWDIHIESQSEPSSGNRPAPPLDLAGQNGSSLLSLSSDDDDATGFSIHILNSRTGQSQPFSRPLPPDSPPEAGFELAGFRLVRELGRGAFARVYLAEQLGLSNRLVALKIARQSIGEESRLLARLQHSHIVPVLSVHEDLASGYSVLCMPYLGGANLAQVLQAARDHARDAWTGSDLIDALDRLGSLQLADPQPNSPNPSARFTSGPPTRIGSPLSSRSTTRRSASTPTGPLSASSRSLLNRYFSHVSIWARSQPGSSHAEHHETDEHQPFRKFLRSAGGISASVWIVARLAEGLDHAHSRGLLHRDLKPSNILLAADGTPMILDFNLSAESEMRERGDENLREKLGGTLPYMAPEHLDAFNPKGSTSPEAVDHRSDIYALGLILFEMLTGRPPFPDPQPGLKVVDQLAAMFHDRQSIPSARLANPDLPWGLQSILQCCLHPNPNQRYQTAAQLAEDLQRHLDDLPLLYAPELSLRERLAKFRRRNPRFIASTNVGLVASLLLMAMSLLLVGIGSQFLDAQALLKFNQFEKDFVHAQFLLNTSSGPRNRSNEGVQAALAALRSYSLDPPRPGWDRQPMVARLDPSSREKLASNASELLLLIARASIQQARSQEGPRRVSALLHAIQRLDQAERLDPHPPASLFHDRARYYLELGLSDQARKDSQRAQQLHPSSARDYYLLGSSLLVRGNPDAAESCLLRAVTLDPTLVWAWFALGFSRADQGRWLEAAADFAACTALADHFPWAFYNRGAALQRAGRLADARLAFDQAILLDPNLIEARYNRALASLGLDDPLAAEADLRFVLDAGWSSPQIQATLAEALAKLGRLPEAEELFSNALAQSPRDPSIWASRGASRLSSRPDDAQADLQKALNLDPNNAQAHLALALLLRPSNPLASLHHLDLALASQPHLAQALEARAVVRGQLGLPSTLDDVARLKENPTPRGLFNASCALCRLVQAGHDPTQLDEALSLLQRALNAGYPLQKAQLDPALAPLHNHPDFQRLLQPSTPQPPTPQPTPDPTLLRLPPLTTPAQASPAPPPPDPPAKASR